MILRTLSAQFVNSRSQPILERPSEFALPIFQIRDDKERHDTRHQAGLAALRGDLRAGRAGRHRLLPGGVRHGLDLAHGDHPPRPRDSRLVLEKVPSEGS